MLIVLTSAMEEPASQFESNIPYHTERIHVAAIYCSDGRFGEHCDDFLQNCLKLPRYDRLIIPGGPACLSDYYDACREGDILLEQLKFLAEAHKLTRVVLIAHQNCAYYTEHLHIGLPNMKAKQDEDLAKAGKRIRETMPQLSIESFYAFTHENHIHFAAVSMPAVKNHADTHWT